MKKIILHEMIVDMRKREIKVGEEIEIEPSQVVEAHMIRAWSLKHYLSDSERNKVSKKNVGGFGCTIKVNLNGKCKCYNVIESHQYIEKAMKGS